MILGLHESWITLDTSSESLWLTACFSVPPADHLHANTRARYQPFFAMQNLRASVCVANDAFDLKHWNTYGPRRHIPPFFLSLDIPP